MPVRRALALLLALAALLAFRDLAFAATSPFGVGLPEQSGAGLIPAIAALQRRFYQELTAGIAAISRDGAAFWWLGTVSFIYGIVHAAGPGHGKVVISSYLLAHERTARRGIAIAFAAALVQAIVAVALIGVMAAILGLTSFAITDTARFLEAGSYALILALGLYLLARKSRPFLARLRRRSAAVSLGAAASHAGHDHAGHDHGRHDHGEHDHGGHGHGGHDHGAHAACGHSHLPDPETLEKGGAKAAVGAILSVGLRPCSGALIVLVFALSQKIFWAGVAATFLMALGTGLTVATLAAIAVGAKGLARRLMESGRGGAGLVMPALEWLGALFITAFGALMLAGALA
ncbi:nickel/cobalt transporter [Afifella sp. IM 167]|uniref:nickel/cobalt transporter n=1 Tax=Afifella sp. IM 167 TaxID=2033586 RepID=UPI001CC9DB90|nr:nickel/cobalt transporter [Afifella sp. IM 167]MBZ8132682.1 nickel transporter [Afifella sp. IM 167]